MMQRAILMPLLAACLFGSTGCVHRELVGFNDHDSKSLTAMRAGVTRNYVFWQSYEHVFYSCSESGDKLDCKRVCGGDNDIVCPQVQGSGSSASTNIR